MFHLTEMKNSICVRLRCGCLRHFSRLSSWMGIGKLLIPSPSVPLVPPVLRTMNASAVRCCWWSDRCDTCSQPSELYWSHNKVILAHFGCCSSLTLSLCCAHSNLPNVAIGVNFCKAPRLEPLPHFLKCKAFHAFEPPLFVRCNFLPNMKVSSTV